MRNGEMFGDVMRIAAFCFLLFACVVLGSVTCHTSCSPEAKGGGAATECIAKKCLKACCGDEGKDRCCCLHRDHCECPEDPTEPGLRPAHEYDAHGRVVPRKRTTDTPSCITCHGGAQ